MFAAAIGRTAAHLTLVATRTTVSRRANAALAATAVWTAALTYAIGDTESVFALIVGCADLTLRTGAATPTTAVGTTQFAIALSDAAGAALLGCGARLAAGTDPALAAASVGATVLVAAAGNATAWNACVLLLVGIPSANQTHIGVAVFAVDFAVETPFQCAAGTLAGTGKVPTTIGGFLALEGAVANLAGGALAAMTATSIGSALLSKAAGEATCRQTLAHTVAFQATVADAALTAASVRAALLSGTVDFAGRPRIEAHPLV